MFLKDFLGTAAAGDPDRLRESEREKSEDAPKITRPWRAGRLAGDDGMEPPY